jgi:hypothetical protein
MFHDKKRINVTLYTVRNTTLTHSTKTCVTCTTAIFSTDLVDNYVYSFVQIGKGTQS